MLCLIHLLLGVIVSYIVALPLGPVNLIILDSSLRYGKKVGISISLGSALAEWLYCLLAVWGVNQLFTSTTLSGHSIFQLLQISSVPVLLWLGISNLRKKESEISSLNYSRNSFWLGAFLNFLNPMLLPLWLGISSYLAAQGILTPQFEFLTFFATGVGIGTFLLHLTLTIIGSKRFISLTTQRKILFSRIIGLAFILFALYQSFGVLAKV